MLPGAADPVWRALSAALWALATSALSVWAGLHVAGDSPSIAGGLACVAGLAAGVLSFRAMRHGPAVQWDGRAWSAVGVDGAACPLATAPDVVVDLDSWMLLRVAQGRSWRWMAVSAGHDRGAWHRSRAALYGGRVDREPSAALPG